MTCKNTALNLTALNEVQQLNNAFERGRGVLLDKLRVTQLAKKFPASYAT
jgi:hypothetical protein